MARQSARGLPCYFLGGPSFEAANRRRVGICRPGRRLHLIIEMMRGMRQLKRILELGRLSSSTPFSFSVDTMYYDGNAKTLPFYSKFVKIRCKFVFALKTYC